MEKNGELVDYTAQLAQGLPQDLLKQARDYLRSRRPDLNREQVEREAIAAVRGYQAQMQTMLPAAPVCMVQEAEQTEPNPEEFTPLVMAAKANGVIE